VEVGESLAEALPPQPLAHDVPEPRASRRLRRRPNPTGGRRLVRGRRERWGHHVGAPRGGRGGAMTMSDDASQVTEHPPVQVLLSTVPPAARTHRQGVVLQQRRHTPLLVVRLKCAAWQGQRRWWWRRRRREDQA
jgi:hypothetical protein